MVVTATAIALHSGSPQAQRNDPVLGTWELDVAKSSFSPGRPLRSQTRTYQQTPAGVRFVLTGTSAAGAPMRVEYTAPYDGKDYPLTGSPSTDTVSLTMVNPFIVEAVEKKAGRPTFHVTRVISPEGHTMTVTSIGTSARGTAIRNVLVFQKLR